MDYRHTVCPRCGGTLVGDGYTTAQHCENAYDVPSDLEPDAPPFLCAVVWDARDGSGANGFLDCTGP